MRSYLIAGLLLAACRTAAPPPPARPSVPPAPPIADLVSPASASGFEHAHGLDWPPERYTAPASTAFKNVQVLSQLPAERLMVAMQSMEANLGVDCQHCHQQGDFSADGKQPKATARVMLKMAHEIDTRFFEGRASVTCYTCHRRDSTPEPFAPPAAAAPWPLPPLSEADAARPAREVFRNLKVLGDMPAGRLPEVMGAFAAALGVECRHCHEPGRWASDAPPAKKRARDMLAMVGAIGKTYFADKKNPVRCGTCHRGDVTPARDAGPMVKLQVSLPGGGPVPRALLVVAPAGFSVTDRRALREAVRGPDHEKFTGVWIAGASETELGHHAPGTYSLCSLTTPADPNPANDPKAEERRVVCAPITVAREPRVQVLQRQLEPL